jgi:predicted alpha-1,2-mannosidase
MRVFLLLSGFALLMFSPVVSAQTRYTKWVNELIGTANEGQTFPATGAPFAMTQWTPQTRAGNTKCVPPYYFGDTKLQGFRASHWLSGSCTQDYGSMTIMPVSGPLRLAPEERASTFDRSTEIASPERYAVKLRDYDIDAEMTGTQRAGILRFRYNRSSEAWLLVEANSRIGEGTIHIDEAQQEVTVQNPVRRIYAGSGKFAGFSGFFVLRFDHRFSLGGAWSGSERRPGADQQIGGSGLPGGYVRFDLKPGEVVTVRVGSSFTSLEEARKNLDAEIPDGDFDRVVKNAADQWEQLLSRIDVTTDPTKKRIFYTAMYHSMLLPRVFSDVDGSYPGFANEGKIEKARGFEYYEDFSLWDTYRALHPLLLILDPNRERDMVKSLIAKGEQGGFMPIYPAWNSYTTEMTGDHANAVIADAWVKGLRGFDINLAYKLMLHNAMDLPPNHDVYLDGRGRRGLDSYLKYGYIPLEDAISDAFHKNEQVSRTLDYAYDDSLIGVVAESLNKTKDAAFFQKRGQNYRNVIDPNAGFARGRHADGTWVAPFDPTKPASYITEGLPLQYTFAVPQDLPGLIDFLGGPEKFEQKLDLLFAGGFYEQGNEPSHHIAYLYDNVGAAWKSQEQLRKIMETQYKDGPGGLAGNDDCGQMSSWYIFSALGFYPVAPGSTRYQIGTPLFDEATVTLAGGKKLHIHAIGAGKGKQYITAVTLNGVKLDRYWLEHEELMNGGVLSFAMSATPNKSWGIGSYN